MIINPFGPYSFVNSAIAIGGIAAYGEPLDRFGFILNVALEFFEDPPGERSVTSGGQPVQQMRLVDTNDIESQVPSVLRAVGLVHAARLEDKFVLVTCAAGRNRSALVVAEYLIQHGHDAQKVISGIQARRAKSLTNETFVNWLLRRR
jgi:protein-tyrosine phosphatase